MVQTTRFGQQSLFFPSFCRPDVGFKPPFYTDLIKTNITQEDIILIINTKLI